MIRNKAELFASLGGQTRLAQSLGFDRRRVWNWQHQTTPKEQRERLLQLAANHAVDPTFAEEFRQHG